MTTLDGASLPYYDCFLGGPHPQPVDGPPGDARFVHPRLWYQLGTAAPPQLRGRLRHRGRFRAGYPLLWLESDCGLLYPYWVPRGWARQVGQLQPGQPPPDFPADLAGALRQVGALVESVSGDLPGHGLPYAPRPTSTELAEHGFVTMPGLLDRAHVAALGRYYRALFVSGTVSLGDSQCPRRYAVHDEPMARFFQAQLTTLVQRLVGAAVRPSYSYSVGYLTGASIDPHTDREQCVYTISLLIDTELPSGARSWPLWLDTAGGAVDVHQQPGDAVLFCGRQLAHWREPLPAGASTSLLLHYVPPDFRGSLC